MPGGPPCQGGLPAGGLSLPGGLPALGASLPGGSPCQGVSLLGVSLPGGLPAWGVSPCQGDGSLPAGGSPCPVGASLLVGGFSLPETPPPVDRITDTCKNITLATTSLRPVKRDRSGFGQFSLPLSKQTYLFS